MSKLNLVTILLSSVFLFTIVEQTVAQSGKRRNKGTSKREIRKRQEEANKKSNYNKFNELVPMGSRSSTARTDYLWSYETANTVPAGGGNISVVSPSRFSRSTGSEFGTSFGSLPLVPMVYYKKRWLNKKLYVATRHQLYSFSPMLHILRNNDNYTFIPETSDVPDAVTLKNELIVSKPFLKELKCGGIKQPYVILTAAVAYDYGFEINATDTEMIDYKFLRPRSGVILGQGGFLSTRLQGDFYLNQNLYLTVAARGLFTKSLYQNAIEQNSAFHFKLSPKFIFTAGYWMNFGKGDKSMIVPVIDLAYNFGSREIRQKGLFGRGM